MKWLQFVVQLVNALLGKKLLNVFTIETLIMSCIIFTGNLQVVRSYLRICMQVVYSM